MRTIRLAAVTLLLGLFTHVAQASTLIRTYAPRYSTTARGELLIVGNANMSCPAANSNCAAARNGTASANNNNDYNMAYVNVDGVTSAPANSSTATLSIPGGSTVLFAGLYWGADTSAGTSGAAAPSASSRNVVQFGAPSSGYAAITASQVDASGTRYSAFADVTARVQAAGSGVYRVAGIQAGTGGDRYAGWSLVVVLGNPTLAPRNMVVFDGYSIINSTAPTSITTTVSGFRTPPTGAVTTQVGFVAYEGDLSSNGDRFRLNTTDLSNAANPVDNAFNSTISALGTLVTTRNPSFTNNFGFDIDLFGTNVLGNNATSADLTFTTGGETYYPALITFQTDVFEPVILSNVTKTVADVNGGLVQPGDVLEYTITILNTGNDGATQLVLTDPIPANTTYVPGSLVVASGANAGAKTDAAGDDQANTATGPSRVVFRLGAGATATAGGTLAMNQSTSIRFRVTVNQGVAHDTVISNQGTVDFVSQTLNEARSGPTPVATVTVSNTADVSVTKTNDSTSLLPGSTTTYVLTVGNAGPMAANGAVLRDVPGTGLSGCAVVSCTPTGGASCPATLAAILGATGAPIPLLPMGGQVQVQVQCNVD